MPKLEQSDITSLILKAGVLVSVSLTIIGVILLFIKGGGDGYSLSYVANYHNPSATVDSKILFPGDFLKGLIGLDGLFFISVGLWVLIFTPVTVLIDALITFAHERNKLYTLLDAIVLFNLLLAIFVIPRFVS
jgi:uncharacterized membrane protein